MTDIDTELNQLRERQEKLRRLIALRTEVNSLEMTLLTESGRHHMIKVIAEEVCASLKYASIGELLGKARPDYIVRPRHVVFYLARQLTEMTYQDIGDVMGGKHHNTVMHGELNIKNRMDVDKPFADLVEQIRLRAEARLQKESSSSQMRSSVE